MKTDNIIEKYKKGNRLNLGITNFNILPFNTRTYRLSYRNGFSGIIGEISRGIEGYEYKKIDISERVDQLLEDDIIDIDDDYLNEFKEMLISFKPIKLSYTFDSIKMLKFIPLSGSTEITNVSVAENKHNNESHKEKDFANFVYNSLFKSNSSLIALYNRDVKTDVVTKLFHQIYNLEKTSNGQDAKYLSIIDTYTDVIIDDLEYLANDEKRLLEHYEALLAFYTFNYAIKCAIKIDLFTTKGDIYWFYEDEKPSKTRKAVITNWKSLRDGVLNRCYINILSLDMINNFSKHNISDPNEIKDSIVELVDFKLFVNELNFLIGFGELHTNTSNASLIYSDLQNNLDKYYHQGKQSGSLTHHIGWFEDLGKKYFLKKRGKYGFTFNLTERFLLFLITVIVRDERLKLKIFFKELNKRGIQCDPITQKHIVSTIEKLGLLERKSDSGDAQYIKSLNERL